MSEPPNNELERFYPDPPSIEFAAMDYKTAEVRSRNYSSLYEAMGQRKYEAFRWGSGMEKIPQNLRDAFSKISPNNASYSDGEYEENGSLVKSLFMEKRLDDGVNSVFVIDLDRSSPHIYFLRNLYTVGKGGTVDLLEELENDTEAYFIPIGLCGYQYELKAVFFGDLDLVSKSLKAMAGIPAYLHEIGHAKDRKLNPELTKRAHELRTQRILAQIVKDIERISPDFRNSRIWPIKRLLSRVGEIGKLILQIENNATDYVRVFMTKKRAEGLDLSPHTPHRQFANQLHVGLATYELFYFGREFTEGEKLMWPIYVQKELDGIIEASNALSRFLMSKPSKNS